MLPAHHRLDPRTWAWHHARMRALTLAALALLCACPPPVTGDDDDDDDTPPEIVEVGQLAVRQQAIGYGVSAVFPSEPIDTGCDAPEDVAGCVLTRCPDGASGDLPPSLDAGDITVSSEAVHTLTFGDGYAPVVVNEGAFFLNRGEISVDAVGGADVGAFAVDFLAPTRIQITTPPLQAVNVRVTNPIAIEWSNSSEGVVRATLLDANATLFATCEGAGNGGGFEIPAEIVGRFPLGGGSLAIESAVSASASVDAASRVAVLATTTATSATGGPALYNVNFEAP